MKAIALSGHVSERDAAMVKAVVAGLMPVVQDLIESATAPLIAENKALASRVAELGAHKAPEPGLCEEAVQGMIDKAISELPEPVDPEAPARQIVEKGLTPLADRVLALEVRELQAPGISEEAAKGLVADAIAALPPPHEPKEVDAAALRQIVDQSVAEAVKAIPAPRDGESVTLDDVTPVIKEEVEKRIAAIPPAKDGVGVAGAVVDRDGALVLTLSDGTQCRLGQVVGRDADQAAIEARIKELVDAIPKPKDGFSLKDFETDFDGERTLTLKFDGGDMAYEHEIELPIPIYRGVWKAKEDDGSERVFSKCDMVSFGGSVWHCQRQTTQKPGFGEDWVLSVRKGRDAPEKPASNVPFGD